MISPRHALRSLLKTPLVTVVAVLSLALGIGANAAIFSIFEQMLLRPLPVPEPDRLVNLQAPGPKPGSQSNNTAGTQDSVFSYPMFRDLEEAQQSFTGIAAHRIFGANLSFAGDTLSGIGMMVSGSYFGVLELQPALGRLLRSEDDETPGAHSLAVLSHAYWKTRFDADPSVIGQSLIVNGHPMTVLGVAPAGFDGTTLGVRSHVFVPISMRGQVHPGWDDFENRRNYWVYLFARLSDGVSQEAALASINVPYRSLIQEVEVPLQEGLSEKGLERFREKEIAMEPGALGQSQMRDGVGTPLLLLMSVTGFVLLIACANIANLLLTKATNRSGEVAIRLSIGARRGQLVGQLLAESFLLALIGAGLGLLVARGTLRLMDSLLPDDGGSFFSYDLGAKTWLFMLVLTLLTSLVGLFPALNSTRSELVVSLKNQGGATTRSKAASRFRSAMATLQIALSMTLLISAGLFTRSLLNVSQVDLGLEVDQMVTFGLSPELNSYSAVESRNLFLRVEETLATLPGVTDTTAALVPLIAGDNWGSDVRVQGYQHTADSDNHSNFNEVGPGFFGAFGIPVLAGREFTENDVIGSPKVAIVNEEFARKFEMGDQVVGKWMRIGGGDEMDIEIVGLTRDTKYSEVKQETPPLFYLPYRQNEELGMLNFYLRSSGDPKQMLSTIRTSVAELDPNLPIEDLRTMEMQVAESVFVDRILSTLSASFAILATVLAAIGLYGVLAYAVAQRTGEIGLRMALGADGARVSRMILQQVAWMTVPGALLGVLAALGLGRIAGSLLFEMEGHDPSVFVSATAVLAAIALLAGLLPARRAARIDPMRALRDE